MPYRTPGKQIETPIERYLVEIANPPRATDEMCEQIRELLDDPNHCVYNPIVKPFDKAGRGHDDYEWLEELCEHLGMDHEAVKRILRAKEEEDVWRAVAYRYLAEGPGTMTLSTDKVLTKMRQALFLLACVMRGY
jgi:hypothetical protein